MRFNFESPAQDARATTRNLARDFWISIFPPPHFSVRKFFRLNHGTLFPAVFHFGFGLGQLLHYGRELNAMDQVIGIMVVIVLIGLLTDKILFSPWEAYLHRRWGTAK